MNLTALKASLKLHEGVRSKAYTDTVGKVTVGCGRNLTDVGLSQDEIDYLLMNDINRAMNAASQYPWFKGLDDMRQNVVVELIFNLGAAGFAEFRNTIRNIETKAYSAAANSMMQSKWASQVGKRAMDLSNQMRTGA